MELITAWVKPPTQIGGMDHLAVQAPCINLYGRLLPGITNVTDRARYYSFYPWIVWALDQAGHKYDDTFINLYRKADCLFTLIAQRHAHVTDTDRDTHAAATIGSVNLAKQIAEVKEGKSVCFSDFTHREEGKNRYFKNKLGGLGQYYLSVLSELNLMDGTARSGVKYTNQVGKLMAEAMDKRVNRKLFLQTIDEDVVTSERLDELRDFCPCQLSGSEQEHSLLCDLFFVTGLWADTDMLARRRSLQTILYLADELAKQEVLLDLEQFRACTYSRALPNGEIWVLPDRLKQNRSQWAVYQRNEFLSLAVQGIFYVLLDAYEESDRRFHSVDELCNWFLQTPEVDQLKVFFDLDAKIKDLTNVSKDWLPKILNWTNVDHEFQLANEIHALCKQDKSTENRSKILSSALKILFALKARLETQEVYGDFIFPPHYFQVYPINLSSFVSLCENVWENLSLRRWIHWLCSNWGINTHLSVALRKLRGQSQSTFQIRPSDQGLEVISVPEAVFTSPRFNQSLRILEDIGALIRKDSVLLTSELGMQLREGTNE